MPGTGARRPRVRRRRPRLRATPRALLLRPRREVGQRGAEPRLRFMGRLTTAERRRADVAPRGRCGLGEFREPAGSSSAPPRRTGASPGRRGPGPDRRGGRPRPGAAPVRGVDRALEEPLPVELGPTDATRQHPRERNLDRGERDERHHEHRRERREQVALARLDARGALIRLEQEPLAARGSDDVDLDQVAVAALEPVLGLREVRHLGRHALGLDHRARPPRAGTASSIRLVRVDLSPRRPSISIRTTGSSSTAVTTRDRQAGVGVSGEQAVVQPALHHRGREGREVTRLRDGLVRRESPEHQDARDPLRAAGRRVRAGRTSAPRGGPTQAVPRADGTPTARRARSPGSPAGRLDRWGIQRGRGIWSRSCCGRSSSRWSGRIGLRAGSYLVLRSSDARWSFAVGASRVLGIGPTCSAPR